MSVKSHFGEFLNSIVVGANVAFASILAGVLTVFEVFSVNAGPLVSLAGFILSLVLIYVNLQNAKINRLKIDTMQRRAGDVESILEEAKKTAIKSGLGLRFVGLKFWLVSIPAVIVILLVVLVFLLFLS